MFRNRKICSKKKLLTSITNLCLKNVSMYKIPSKKLQKQYTVCSNDDIPNSK